MMVPFAHTLLPEPPPPNPVLFQETVNAVLLADCLSTITLEGTPGTAKAIMGIINRDKPKTATIKGYIKLALLEAIVFNLLNGSLKVPQINYQLIIPNKK
jgi:hypothetical protein